jgi:high-affinity Fe2+/Pb2+ permease
LSEIRTLGEVIMIAAALALVAVGAALAAGYQRYDRPLREFLRSGEWPILRSPFRLKFFDEHSA